MRILFAVILLLFVCAPASALNLQLSVKETQGVSRTGELVHNGIPLAKADNITSTSGLLISDGSSAIPSTFEVLARWGGAKEDTSKPIRWLLVSFPATVSANSTGTYYLRDYGTPASITDTVDVTDGASTITVASGGATFVISETAMTVFDSISIGGNTVASGNGSSQTTINGQSSASANSPTVTIERQNDQYVCIKATGTYANTPTGTGDAQPIHYRIRYEFFAGSPVAIITHKFFWPGYDGTPQDGTGQRTIDNAGLTLPDMSGFSSQDVYATASVNYTGISAEAVSVSQNRRTLFADAHSATVDHGATSQSTTFATHPAVISRATNGALAVSIGNMQYFEPQSITATSGGKITANTMSEGQYFSEVQGTWSRVGVGALPNDTTFAGVNASVIMPIEHRLMAMVTPAYLSSSYAFDKVPNPASSDTTVQAYLSEVAETITTTKTFLATQKFQGLMTWGALSRYDAEVGAGTGWDKVYSGALLTDYHNTWLTMTIHGLSNLAPDELSDYSIPAARRMLHTQIFQPDDYSSPSSTYMGWAPAGYARYRTDVNSSHSYFENLYAYYYLTGDMEVIDILDVGAETRDGWYTRNGAALDDPTTRPVSYVDYYDRPFHQAASVFDFLGHVGDSKFLDDWQHMYVHTVTTNLVLVDNSGTEYGFFVSYDGNTSPADVEQSWMAGLYTAEGFYRLWVEYGDIELGANNLAVSRVLKAIAKTFYDYNRTTYAGGSTTRAQDWSNGLTVSWSGNRIGGTLVSATHRDVPGAPTLFIDGKCNIAATLLRAGTIANDATLLVAGKEGATWLAGSSLTFDGYGATPLGKVLGIAYTRLTDGIANFAQTHRTSQSIFRTADGKFKLSTN